MNWEELGHFAQSRCLPSGRRWLRQEAFFPAASCTQQNACEVNLWFVYLLLVHFYCWIVFHWINISLFVYWFICWWTFELFLIWSKCFWGHLFSAFVGKYLGVVLLGQRICLCLILWKKTQQPPNQNPKVKWFSKMVVPFYASTNEVWVQLFLKQF